MEPLVRETLLGAVVDLSTPVEEIHLYEHWVVVKAGRYEMSTRFTAADAPYVETGDTWLGDLIGMPAAEVARQYLAQCDVLKIAVGMACLKCVIPSANTAAGGSSLDIYESAARTRRTCVIGHFHQAEAWRNEGRPVTIVELRPREGDIHWDEAHEALAHSEIVFMTGLTLVNGTFGEVIRRTPAASLRIIMGPTVPVTSALFGLGVSHAGGTRIRDVSSTLRYFGMGGGSIMYAPPGALEKTGITAPGPS